MKKAAFCFFVGLIARLTFAQSGNLPFNRLSTADGLTSNHAPFIQKDSKGLIWLGSVDGTVRFAGRKPQIFRPEKGQAGTVRGEIAQSSFFEDAESNIWFGTNEAINCFDRRSGKFRSHPIEIGGQPLEEPFYALFFIEKKRFLWLVASDMLFRFDLKTAKADSICPLQTATCAVDTFENGSVRRLCAARWDYAKGIELLDFTTEGHLVRRRAFFEKHEKGQKALTVKSAFFDPDGAVWLAADLGLQRFDPEKPTRTRLFCPSEKGPNPIRSVVEWDKRFLLLAAVRPPLLFFDREKDAFSTAPAFYMIGKKAELSNGATDVSLDATDGLWLHAKDDGIFFRNRWSKGFRQPAGIENGFQARQIVQSDDGQLFLLNQNGQVFESKKGKIAPANWGQKARTICPLAAQSVGFTAGSDIFLVDQKGVCRKKASIAGASFFFQKQLRSGSLLFGTNVGLRLFEPQKKQIQPLSDASKIYQTACEDRFGRLWAFDIAGILDVMKPTANGHFRLEKSLHDVGFVNQLHESGNWLWAATSKGLLRIDLETFEPNLFDEANSGWPNHYIQSILEDPKGRFWMGNNRGILRIDPRKPADFRQFTTTDGLSSDEYSAGCALIASDGEFWFGGKNGIDIFRPEEVRDIGHAPQLGLLDLKIHEKSWQGDSAIFVKQCLELPFFDNTLRFEMAAMEYLDPSKNQFKVRLSGIDRDWVKLGTVDNCFYPNLPPGRYLFEFVAANAEGIWNNEADSRKIWITICPPFWQTWWFRSLLFLLIAGIAFWAYRYKMAQQRREFELLQQKTTAELGALRAFINPHFLFNALNSLNAFILTKKSESASAYLLEFASLMRKMLEHAQRPVANLFDELELNELYVRIEQRRFAQPFELEIDVADDIDQFDTFVPSMILQPYIENAIWHGLQHRDDAAGGWLLIKIDRDEQYLVCQIEDNGVGRARSSELKMKKGASHRSQGIDLTERRLEKLSGSNRSETIDLFDEKGEPAGTRVVLRIDRFLEPD